MERKSKNVRRRGDDLQSETRSDGAGTEALRPTAMTIARQLGVSKSTISRALNDDASISELVRNRVKALAREIGYRPNAIARSLVTRQSGVIALIIGDSHNPFYPEQLDRLLVLLRRKNFQLMLFQVPSGGDVVDVFPTLFQYQLDACMIASVTMSSQADRILADHQMPTVLINRVPRDSHGCAVLCNNAAGGREVARRLLATGAKKIAFIAGPDEASTSLERETGFVTCLRQSGVHLHARVPRHYTFEGGFAAGLSLLQLPERPDAIFAANDIMAIGAVDAMRTRKIRVPEEMQIAGFDNIRAAGWPAYDLTTFAQPMDLLLERAIELIQERIAGKKQSEAVSVNGELVVRGSTKPAQSPHHA
ncbi:MAG: LacI family DNA-binding transcriptional regulator [bacterium]